MNFLRVYVCDILEAPIEENSIDAIICDPPYARKHLDCYRKLAIFAQRKLKPNGVLLAMCGTFYIKEALLQTLYGVDEVYNGGLVLKLYSMLSYGNPKGTYNKWGRRYYSKWKPILWFVKGIYLGKYQKTNVYTDGYCEVKKGQIYHKWGQSLPLFTELVKNFSRPLAVVCDPCLGGATSGVAALMQNRSFIGVDIDRKAVENGLNRIGRIFDPPLILTLSKQ